MKKHSKLVDVLLMIFVAVIVLLIVQAPSGCGDLPQSWVEADRATYDALKTPILRWVEADTTLSELEREDYYQLIWMWGRTLEEAEKLGGK